jgi:hypothetical protein
MDDPFRISQEENPNEKIKSIDEVMETEGKVNEEMTQTPIVIEMQKSAKSKSKIKIIEPYNGADSKNEEKLQKLIIEEKCQN